MAARVVSIVVLVVHLGAGIGALVLLPRGFAFGEIRCWSNTIIPAVSCAAVVIALVGVWFPKGRWIAGAVIAAAAGGWLAVVAIGAVMFPQSVPPSRWAIPAVIAVGLLVLAWAARQQVVRSAIGFAIGVVFGVVVIVAQRAPAPSTHPAGGVLAEVTGDGVEGTEHVDVPCGTHRIRVRPLLSFTSRSPDRTWTILSPDPVGHHRAFARSARTDTSFAAEFADDGQSTLVVREADGAIQIEATSVLHEPVYSHLNSFTALDFAFDADIAFSPIATAFPIEPADYPTGRPSKLAYLDDDGLHVARASSGEKGPFDELARGPMKRGEPLAIEIRPRDGGGCRFVFEDWSAQVSMEPSPTAGWGVPQNSIQFFSVGAASVVLLALAETGPGRGFDSVGHAAGTYRNRITVSKR